MVAKRGDRVRVQGYGSLGTVRFVGLHAVHQSPRVGVELDKPEGKNNGTIGGTS
jgi:dynactin complex subunit